MFQPSSLLVVQGHDSMTMDESSTVRFTNVCLEGRFTNVSLGGRLHSPGFPMPCITHLPSQHQCSSPLSLLQSHVTILTGLRSKQLEGSHSHWLFLGLSSAALKVLHCTCDSCNWDPANACVSIYFQADWTSISRWRTLEIMAMFSGISSVSCVRSWLTRWKTLQAGPDLLLISLVTWS